MPNYKPKLIGPDTKHGAWRDPSLKEYIWHVVWYEARKRRVRSLGVTFGGDYGPALEEFLGTISTPAAKTGLIRDVLTTYLNGRLVNTIAKPQALSRTRALMRAFGAMRVDQVNEKVCRKFADGYLSRSTARNHLLHLKAAITYAGLKADIWAPVKSDARARIVTEEEVTNVVRAFVVARLDHYAVAVHVCFHTAARIDSVLSLGWERNTDGGWIDLARGHIHLKPHGRIKTNKQKPVVPIGKRLRPILEAERAKGNKWLCTQPDGRRATYRPGWGALQVACTRAGVEPFSWHCLCHTRITDLVEKGESLALISKFTGRSLRTLMENYVHLVPDAGAKQLADRV